MAKVVITIEDGPNNKVKITCSPLASEIMQKIVNTNGGITSAEGYALHAINAIRTESKKPDNKFNLILPKVLR